MADIQEILTITELNNLLKDSVKKIAPRVRVKGELSGIRNYDGTLYATLKDDNSLIEIIKFKMSDDMKDARNGDVITAAGNVEFYPKNGKIKLICYKIELGGEGKILRKLDILKNQFEKRGYFDNKKSFPNIRSIGIVTAKDGAALQDILYVLKNNNFYGKIYVINSPVQGIDCPKGICNGIKFFNSANNVDIIMITRGGGSIDDLIGFSDPSVIEEMHNSNIFTMSAVGHEVDNMLSDFVADVRAPTPSIGAEMICKSCPNINVILEIYKHKVKHYNKIINDRFDTIRNNVNIVRKRMYTDKYDQNSNKLNQMNNKLSQTIIDKFNNIDNSIKFIRSSIDLVKNLKTYNCNILLKNRVITSIDDLMNGIYTININGNIKKIEIKII